LHRYRIQATAEEIAVDVTLTGEVPAWRPSTGYMLFGADRSLEFAWLPSVPQGAVTVTYTVDGEQHSTTGVGYHDHNWGNVGLLKRLQGSPLRRVPHRGPASLRGHEGPQARAARRPLAGH